jgi:hypothetical protein
MENKFFFEFERRKKLVLNRFLDHGILVLEIKNHHVLTVQEYLLQSFS